MQKQPSISATEFARNLRKHATDPERLFWCFLRNRRLCGLKFRRQHPMPPYTLDFFCAELGLAIELDGSQHADNHRDLIRDAFLAKQGIEVLRFYNNDCLQRPYIVLTAIYQRVQALNAAKARSRQCE